MITVPVAENFSPNSTSPRSGRAAPPRFFDRLRGGLGDLHDRLLRPGKRLQHILRRPGGPARGGFGPGHRDRFHLNFDIPDPHRNQPPSSHTAPPLVTPQKRLPPAAGAPFPRTYDDSPAGLFASPPRYS